MQGLLPVRSLARRAAASCAFFLAPALGACENPQSFVVLDNDFAPSPASDPIIVQARWQAVSIAGPIAPGESSDALPTVPASANTAYVLVAPGLGAPDGGGRTTFVVLESRTGFDVHLGDTLHIPVDDDHFAGDCAAGSTLTQDEADFVTRLVFPSAFAGLHYDAATCTTSLAADAAAD